MPTIDPNTTQRRSVLVLLNTAMGEIGMPQITSVQAGTDTTVQLLYLANGVGARLALLPFWSDLIETWSITTVDAQEGYDLPVDWGVPLSGTSWDRSSHWPLVGPVPPLQWQVLQSSIQTGGPSFRFRFSSLQLQLYPAPGAGLDLVHDYLSTGWVLGLDGAVNSQRKPRITLDSDYILLGEEMFICGVKLAWLTSKRLDTKAISAEFKAMFEVSWGAANGAAILPFGPGINDTPLLSWANIPDAGFGP